MKPIPTTDFVNAIRGAIKNPGSLSKQIRGISLDTRTLKPNDVYWAIAGKNYDGHDFVEEAFNKQASAAIVNETSHSPNCPTAERLITVDDTLKALHRFAAWHRKGFQATTIGITGSYGKTTTRELLFSVLSTKHNCLQNKHNQNNEIGIPLTIFELTEHHQYLIAELGAAKPGDIRPLAEITSPKIGLITGIGPAHLAGFKTKEQIIETKGDLIASLPEDGLAVIPGGEEWSDPLIQRAACRVITYGSDRINNYHATYIEASNQHLKFHTQGEHYTLPLIGRHHVTTGLAAVALATELGYSPEQIQQGFDRFQPIPGRGRVVRSDPWTIIDDTYNANPSATIAACRMLADWQTPGRRFLVLGDMLELGPDSKRYHEELGRLAGELEIDFIYAYGEFASSIANGVRSARTLTRISVFDEQQELIQELRTQVSQDDVVLVKGSRGMRMEHVVEALLKTPKSNEAVASVN